MQNSMEEPSNEQKKTNGFFRYWRRFSAKVAPASCSTNSGQPLHSECVIFLIMLYLHGNIQ